MAKPPPVLSVVIPARNEELELPNCLSQNRQALEKLGLTHEIIVVDDDSDDTTAEIVLAHEARLVSVCEHNIGAVRNAGAQVAQGQILFFVDADTVVPVETFRAAIQALESGSTGGGAKLVWDRTPPFFARLSSRVFLWVWQGWFGWATGCFMFCHKSTFDDIGGFDTEYYAAEERYLSQALMERGTFSIVEPAVISSARKMRLFSTWELVCITVPALLGGFHRFKSPEGLEFFYDVPRESADETPSSSIKP